MSYDNQRGRRTYRFPAAAIATAGAFARVVGPAGLVGRVRGMEYVVTTDTTVASSSITVGVAGAVGPTAMSVPVATANNGAGMTDAELSRASKPVVAGVNDVALTADAVVEIRSDGAASAGAADIIVTIDWF